jgi:nucleotide-binding universal stress UspA family protein
MALSKISKILVPIDGSASSMRAADAAVELAKKYSNDGGTVEVIALHVIDISPKLQLLGAYGFSFSDYTKKMVEATQKEANSWFSKIEENAKVHDNLHFRSEVTDNSAMSIVGEIVNYAKRENVDIIVIGTRGQSEFAKLLLGSVTSGVTVYAPCTVMVIK